MIEIKKVPFKAQKVASISLKEAHQEKMQDFTLKTGFHYKKKAKYTKFFFIIKSF